MKFSYAIMLCALFASTACDKLPSLVSMQETSENSQSIPGTLTTQGYDLLAKGQLRPALSLFEQAITTNERDIRALQGKGIALNRLGKNGEAEIAYGQALKIAPQDIGVNNNLAMSKILRGEYEEALAILTPLHEKHAANTTVAENIALANCLLGRREDARKLYSKRLPTAAVEENLRFCKKYDDMRKQ